MTRPGAAAQAPKGASVARAVTTLDFELPLPLIDETLTRALAEDLGAGDVTTDACVPADAQATANAVARKAIVS